MSTRSIIVLSLIILVCVAVIAASALAREQLTALFGQFGFREFSRLFRFFAAGPFRQPEFFQRSSLALVIGRGLVSAIASYAFLCLAGLLTLFAFPRQLRVVRDSYTQGASAQLRVLGVGALGALVLGLLTVLGVLTFTALPLALALLGVLVLAAWSGLVGLALALGRAINRWAGLKAVSPILDLTFGTLVLFTLTRIPFVGTISLALLTLWALGTAVLTRFGQGGAWSLAAFNQMEESQP